MIYAMKSAAAVALGLLVACTSTPDIAVDQADPELTFVRGYRSADDACKLTGESAFTTEFLDDAADLVSCPTGSESAASLVAETHAQVATQTASYTLYSVPVR